MGSGLTFDVTAVAARLSDDKAGSSVIPAMDAELEKCISLTCRNLTHMKRRRPHRTYSAKTDMKVNEKCTPNSHKVS